MTNFKTRGFWSKVNKKFKMARASQSFLCELFLSVWHPVNAYCTLYSIMWLSFFKKVLIWWECDSLLTEQLNQTLWLDINIIIRIRAHLLVDLWILDVRKTLSSHCNSKSLLSRFGQNQFSSKPKLLHNWLERLQILTKIRFCLKVWGCCYWTAHSDETLWPLDCPLR